MKNGTKNKQQPPPPEVAQMLMQAERAYQMGNMQLAESVSEAVLARFPQYVPALYIKTRIAQESGRLEEAGAGIEALLKRVSNEPRIWLLKGNLEAMRARFEDAQQAFRKVTRLAPMEALGWLNLAKAELEAGLPVQAESDARMAVQLASSNADAQNTLARALIEQEKYAAAEQLLTNLLLRIPTHGEAIKNLAGAYALQGKIAQAKQLLEKLDPASADPEAIKALVAIMRDCGELDLVDQLVVQLDKRYPHESAWKIGLADRAFAKGQYQEGWAYYEYKEGKAPAMPWNPSELAGKQVCVYTDQGLGDDVFFWRFLPAIQQMGAQVSYQVSAKLLSLASRLPCVGQVSALEEMPIQSDVRVPISSIPHLTEQAWVPHYAEACRIKPLPEKITEANSALRALGNGPYLGLTLRGGRPLREVSGMRKLGIYSKVVELTDMATVLRNWPGQIVWLQFKPLPGEVQLVEQVSGKPVLDASALNDDLEGMLAMLDALDEYVTVSNTNVHLRAMLGKPSRVLVPMPPEFRWGREGDASPWFPGTSLFRQSSDGRWEAAMSQLRDSLSC